jgi:hypothetical protein
MRPSAGTPGFRVSRQIKNLNPAFPDGLAAKDFMDGRGFPPSRAAIVPLHHRHLNARTMNVIPFIRHSV